MERGGQARPSRGAEEEADDDMIRHHAAGRLLKPFGKELEQTAGAAGFGLRRICGEVVGSQ